MPISKNGHHAQPAAQRCTQDHSYVGRKPKDMPNDHHNSPGKRGNCVQISTKNCRGLVYKDVPQDAAANTAEHAHHRGHRRIEARCQGLLSSGNGEQSQAYSIKEQDGPAVDVNLWVPPKRDQSSRKADSQVVPVVDSGRRHSTNEQIADDATRVPSRKRKHHETEEIKIALHPSGGPA